MYNIAIPLRFLNTGISNPVPYVEIPFDFGGGSYTNCYYQLTTPIITNKLPVKYSSFNNVSRLNKVSATKGVNFNIPLKITFDGTTSSTDITYSISIVTDPLNNIIKITAGEITGTPPVGWDTVNSAFTFLSITLVNE